MTIVVRDKDFVGFKMRVALSMWSHYLPGQEMQFSLTSQQNCVSEHIHHPVQPSSLVQNDDWLQEKTRGAIQLDIILHPKMLPKYLLKYRFQIWPQKPIFMQLLKGFRDIFGERFREHFWEQNNVNWIAPQERHHPPHGRRQEQGWGFSTVVIDLRA